MTRALRLCTVSILAATGLFNVSLAQEVNTKMLELIPEIHAAVDADAASVQEIYKDIHEQGELGFMETRPAGVGAREFRALGFDVKTGIGKTGVVGILENGDGPVFMFRGDNERARLLQYL